jgi:hypothetical protein
MFQIQVRNNDADAWRVRVDSVEADSANAALRSYGIRGSRPYKGSARSKSGKQFRAIELG